VKIFGFELRRVETKSQQFEDVIQRLLGATYGGSYDVTAANCMQSPTVHAIVTAISRRIAVSPVHVFEKIAKAGREEKNKLPNHPVAKLLQRPNSWQTRTSYWFDAASTFIRYGRYYAWKSRGSTGPIRELLPIVPTEVSVHQDRNTWRVTYRRDGEDLDSAKLHVVRGPARNFIEGDSPVKDVQTAIALEILAEKFGALFFANGALPLAVFKPMTGSKGFRTKEEQDQFVADFQSLFGGNRKHRAMYLPSGIEMAEPLAVENDKAQMIETRRYQRTVIAGALGVPPHLVGDLDRATFNNVEQQDLDFTANCVLPVVQAFEAAMERDLLTDEDRAAGRVIRFNLDAVLRGDFKSRQEGLQIQRQNGVISPNEWREIEGKNPLTEDQGGEEYIRPANMVPPGTLPSTDAPRTLANGQGEGDGETDADRTARD
jgi:HK97 family phage portal protein